MIKKLLIVSLLCCVMTPARAIIWKYGDFDSGSKECSLIGWSGSQPTSGKLTLPSAYKHTDGVEYAVVDVKEHALDNLTEVTQITIPSSIYSIGNTGVGDDPTSCVNNFYNCPKLVKFLVNDANTVFKATADGMLCSKSGKMLLRVPAKLAVQGGEYSVPTGMSRICKDAFAGNSTISVLRLSGKMFINGNGGLNLMKKLKEISLLAGGRLKVDNGVLIETDRYVIACAPLGGTTSVKLPSTVTWISEHAFYNCSGLKSVSMGDVEYIGDFSFAGTGLTSVSVPGTVTYLGKSAFEDCRDLKTITLSGGEDIPEGFARRCSSLTSVNSPVPPRTVKSAAFKDCSSLETFPFSGGTIYYDSIFYGCGFKEVVFDDAANSGFMIDEAFLANCRNLVSIDASAIAGTDDYSFSIGESFASGCPALKKVRFPDTMSFWGFRDRPASPAFGYYCDVEQIVLHWFSNFEDRPQFAYSSLPGKTHFTPRVYIAATNPSGEDYAFHNWPVKSLFAAGNGATLQPMMFIDAYMQGTNDVYPGSVCYVPGGTSGNFSRAAGSGCEVHEMFGLNFIKSSDALRVEIDGNKRPSGLGYISGFRVSFDNGEEEVVGNSGTAISAVAPDKVGYVRVSYNLDNVPMTTIYPSSHWLSSGLETVCCVTRPAVHGDMLRTGDDEALFTVHDLYGMTLLSGKGSECDLSGLGCGTYIICVTTSQGTDTIKVVKPNR